MRTTPEEMRRARAADRAQAQRGRGADGPLRPLKGVSAIDVEGQPFRDAEADEALFAALREGVDPGKAESTKSTPTSTTRPSRAAMADRLHELIQEAALRAPRPSPGCASRSPKGGR